MYLIVCFGLLIAGFFVDPFEISELLIKTSGMFAIAGGLCYIGDKLGNLFKKENKD